MMLFGLVYQLTRNKKLALLTIFFFLTGEFYFGSRKLARRCFWGLTVMTLIAVAIAAPWHILIHLKLGSSYWQQSWGYHVFSRLARSLEGHTSNLGLFYCPFQTICRLGVFFPFAIIGMTRRVPTLDPVARRFHWRWFLVPFLLFTLTTNKFHTYFLLFLLPLL